MSEKKYSETVEPASDVIVDDATEYTAETETVKDSVIVEQVTDIVEDVIVKGVVTDCGKLNVRREPTSDSKVITTISSGTEVEINNEESTDEFYKICTAVGVEGFCMRKFINILE